MLGSLPTPSQVQDDHMMEAEDDQNNNSNSNSNSNSAPALIGIIHPPLDIRTLVDEIASYVAKKGPVFEKRIIISHAQNPKYNFLNGSDPYHAYYQHRLSEFRSQNQNPADVPPAETGTDPPEKVTIRLPEGITGEELDIINRTAQSVARNGISFLTGLRSRENNNPQFHFLKPTHDMFMFFASLADAYMKVNAPVLLPPGSQLCYDLKNLRIG